MPAWPRQHPRGGQPAAQARFAATLPLPKTVTAASGGQFYACAADVARADDASASVGSRLGAQKGGRSTPMMAGRAFEAPWQHLVRRSERARAAVIPLRVF